MDMNLRDIMILVDGEDRTEDISKIYYDPQIDKMMISYCTKDKVYSYHCHRIQKLDNPVSIDCENRVVFINNIPVFDVQYILNFGEKLRIFRSNGKAQTISPEEFHMEENHDVSLANKILSYLKEISQYTSSEKNKDEEGGQFVQEAFLRREMDRLAFVHPESVLNAYLNEDPIKQDQLNLENTIFPFRFNLSQKKALENALTSSISVIEGPPGTGKTQTILNIISNLIAVQGNTVAVVSSNNEAVKNVMEKMSKKGYGFLTAMLGKKENQKNFFANMPVVPTEIDDWNCEETVEELSEQIKEINKKLNYLLSLERKQVQLKQDLSDWQLEQKHFEAFFMSQNVQEIQHFPLMRANAEKLIDFLAETSLAKERNKDRTIVFKLKLLLKYGIFHQKYLYEHETSILLAIEREFYKKQIQNLENEIASLNEQLRRTHFEDILQEHQLLSEKIFRKHLYKTHRRLQKPCFTKENYKNQFGKFIKNFPVILSTTYALRMSIPQDYLLDYVIIDEASQVDLITGALVLSCCRKVIIVGDSKQLPQITDSKIKDKLTQYPPKPQYDYFSNNILSSIIHLYGEQLPRQILREHYRCHPKIIQFCNQRYYDGKLIPYTSPSLSENPLCIYRTSEGNHMRRVTFGEKKGIYNQRELDVIIKEILNCGDKALENEHIGIVTPYRKQAEKAKEQTSKGIESDTVHKYQGREKDIMIMSTVISESGDDFNLSFVDDPHMVNVAVSRAIQQFILVTDHDLFYKKGKHIGDLIRYIQYNTLEENVMESKIVSVFDLLYRRYSKKLLRYKAKMNPDARYKSEEALRVLLDEILNMEEFHRFDYIQGMLLQNLLNDTTLLTEEELNFIKHRASIDFVVFNKMDKSCALVIEVDGFAFHENNPKQLQRDRKKDEILKKYSIPILRLSTNGSGECEKIKNALRK